MFFVNRADLNPFLLLVFATPLYNIDNSKEIKELKTPDDSTSSNLLIYIEMSAFCKQKFKILCADLIIVIPDISYHSTLLKLICHPRHSRLRTRLPVTMDSTFVT